MHRLAAALLLLALLATAASVAAEHTVYTRYVVLGFVKDAQGRLLREQPVELVREKTGLVYNVVTDDAGFYVVVVRLGDESAGEALTLRVGAVTTRITARFDPADHKTDRGTRMDVDGSRFVERATAFFPTLTRFMGAEAH